MEKNTKITQFLNKPELTKAIHRSELKLSYMFAKQDIAMNKMQIIPDLLKDIFPDSQICTGMKSKRNKATYIIKNAIYKSIRGI
jgi:hypothetical protein